VAYSKYNAESSTQNAASLAGGASEGSQSTVWLRQWGLGEVVTAVAASGMVVRNLEEEPGVKTADYGLPKLFVLVATKL